MKKSFQCGPVLVFALALNISCLQAHSSPGLVCESIDPIEASEALAFIRTGLPCRDLMSPTPPSPLSFFSERITADSFWAPYCSILTMRSFVRTTPTISMETLLDSYAILYRDLDVCTDHAAAQIQSRVGALASLAASTRALARERIQAAGLVRDVLPLVRDTCCYGEGQDCRQFFEDLPIRYCDEIDPLHRQMCESMGAVNLFHTNAGLDSPSLRVTSTIAISPILLRRSYGVPARSMIAHELGHSCAVYQRWKGLVTGDAAARASLETWLSNSRRDLDATNIRFFSQLFRRMGLNDASIACYLDVARQAQRSRFAPERPCPSHQGSQYLEETFAAWMAMHVLIEDHLEDAFPSMCFGIRDAFHPLGPDVTRCALLTPTFRVRLERASGCLN